MIRAIAEVERDVIGALNRAMEMQDILLAVPDEPPARVKVAALNLLCSGSLVLDEQCRLVRNVA